MDQAKVKIVYRDGEMVGQEERACRIDQSRGV